MPDFSAITIESGSVIRPLLKPDICRSDCNFLWANLCGWQRKYNLAYTQLSDNTLIIREGFGKQTRYILPQQIITPKILQEIIALSPEGITLFSCSSEFVDSLTAIISTQPSIKIESVRHESCWDDYIYSSTQLSTLTGKHYQPKRNHINKFKALHPDYQIESLSEKDFDQCLILAKTWMAEEFEKMAVTETQNLQDEFDYIQFSFNHFHQLELEGLTLKVKDELVAFCFGAPLNNTTFNTCIEKACSQYPESYAVINQAMAQKVSERFLLINREEDLGLEGLRKAKQSYHPCCMTEKYEIKLSY